MNYPQPTTHVRLDTLHRLTFPDGSVLRGARRRGYLPQPGRTGITCEWYLFHGKQFTLDELERWGVQIEEEGAA